MKLNPVYVGRRGELMAELFLQGLGPRFLARTTTPEFAFDFFIGFENPRGGINTFAVEVKATEQNVKGTYNVRANIFAVLAHSNIPTLLLVADVKRNALFFAWLEEESTALHVPDDPTNVHIRVPVTSVGEESKRSLIRKMTA